MRLYLTSAKANEPKMEWLRGWLEKQGHRVVSTWFDKSLPVDPQFEAPVALIELDGADAVIEFTGDDEMVSPNASFELGYAYRAGKQMFYIGEPSSMFMERYGKRWPTAPPKG